MPYVHARGIAVYYEENGSGPDLLVAHGLFGSVAKSVSSGFRAADIALARILYEGLAEQGYQVETSRAVFVPLKKGGLPRMWSHSGVFEGVHIQLCLREPRNILAVWSARKDGRYGKDAP